MVAVDPKKSTVSVLLMYLEMEEEEVGVRVAEDGREQEVRGGDALTAAADVDGRDAEVAEVAG